MARGAYATAVKGVLPTLTYPSHTTILTGVSPAKHGIVNNYNVRSDQQEPARLVLVRVGHSSPDLVGCGARGGIENCKRALAGQRRRHDRQQSRPDLAHRTADDRKLLRALSTQGLQDGLERDLGGAYPDGIDESVEADERRAAFAARLLEKSAPDFLTVYFAGLDHIEHAAGPDTPEARDALERIDAALAKVVAAARKRDPKTVRSRSSPTTASRR